MRAAPLVDRVVSFAAASAISSPTVAHKVKATTRLLLLGQEYAVARARRRGVFRDRLPPLAETPLAGLIDRAESQLDGLEQTRARAALVAFGGASVERLRR